MKQADASDSNRCAQEHNERPIHEFDRGRLGAAALPSLMLWADYGDELCIDAVDVYTKWIWKTADTNMAVS
jgi:hypothetical protein